MASATDWARTIGTTLVTHLREEELTTFRKFKIFALLEGNGKVAMNQGGRGFDWQVRFKNQPVTSNTGESPRVFSRHNLWQRAYLPYRGYTVTDQVTKREMLENRGAQALIDVAGKMASRLQESMEQHLSREVYVDGGLTGNEDRFHGLESMFAISGSVDKTTGNRNATALQADVFGWPLATYAGLSTALGGLAGSKLETGSWPYVQVDPEYDYYSPLVVNYNTNGLGTGASTWAGQCLEVMREGINHAKRNDTKEAQLDLIVLHRSMYIQFLNKLDARERAVVSKTSGLRSYGFGDVTELDGVEVTTEYAVPTGCGYGISIGNMEMKCMESSLMVPEGPYFNEELQAYRYAVGVLANIKMKSPRNFVKFTNVTGAAA